MMMRDLCGIRKRMYTHYFLIKFFIAFFDILSFIVDVIFFFLKNFFSLSSYFSFFFF